MKKNIIIGCPYTSMACVSKAIRELVGDGLNVVNTSDVVGVNGDIIFIGNGANPYLVSDFKSSFIRYPYDLIPPHAGSYLLREDIEFYKSLALLFDSVAINALGSTWMLRNRAYSLGKARLYGAKVAQHHILKSGFPVELLGHEKMAVKALGNCFVCENPSDIDESLCKYLTFEEDDGDFAAIFPASLLDKKQVVDYMNEVGAIFIQEPVYSKDELRVYSVGNKIFCYKRALSQKFDRSSDKYESTEFILSDSTISAIASLKRDFKLGFICFDLIIDSSMGEIVIDINPYGSIPRYEEFPEVATAIAELLVYDYESV